MHAKSTVRLSLMITVSLIVLSMLLTACQAAATPAPTSEPVATTAPTATAAPTATSAPTATAAPTATSAPKFDEPTIAVAEDAKLGKILVDSKGMTLYMFTKDEADKSNCNAACLANWPPLLTGGAPLAGTGIDAAKLGSTATSDGRKIVTYNHFPLYYWVKDTKAGDTTGQNVGKVWFVLDPTGAPNKTVAAANLADFTINVVQDAKLGKILVDSKGMTLYLYTKDEADKSNCNAACLANWPPLLAVDNVKLGEGLDAAKLGTTATSDGRKMITYNHFPLYYWVKDTKAGDTTGQNVGKVWFVLDPTGTPNKTVAEAPKMADFTINVVEDPKLGKILVDSKGMTLYLYTKDEANKSNCAGGCLANWPPLLAVDNIKVGAGVDAAKLGTTTTADGRKMITYDKKPLYYWVKDTKPGDTTGQNVGTVWFVVAP